MASRYRAMPHRLEGASARLAMHLLAVAALLFLAWPVASRADAAPQAAARQDAGLGLIAYAGTDGNIWVTDPEGEDPRQVTTTGTVEDPFTRPRWSPDGTALVFSRGQRYEATADDAVYLVRDGTLAEIPNVRGCGYPTFLPDGERLLYACGLGGDASTNTPTAEELATDPSLGFISISRLDGSDWRVLVPYTVDGGGFPDWNSRFGRPPVGSLSDVSPDGTVLLTAYGMVGSTTTWEVNVAAGTLAELELPIDDDVPDGGSQQYRHVAPLAGEGELLAVRCRGACTAGSPADEAIEDIVTVDRDDASVETLLTFPRDTWGSAPSLDPTARWIAYESRYGEGSGVWVVSVPDGTPRPIATGSAPAWQPVAASFALPDAPAAASTDVPMYRVGAGGAGVQPGPVPIAPLDVLWRLHLGSEPAGSPVIAGDVLFVAAHDGSVRAVDAWSGTERWLVAEGSQRVAGTPALSGGTVFVSRASWPGAFGYGTVSALDGATGQQLWEFETTGRPSGSPIVDNGTVYIGTDAGYLYGLDAVAGTETWRHHVGLAARVAPAIEGETVFVASADGSLLAIEAFTGTELWRFSTGAVQPLTAPTVIDGMVYVGGADGFVHALDAETGAEIWRLDTGGAVLADPVAASGTIYVGSDSGDLVALDAATGAERWRYNAGGPVRTTPTVTADSVIVSSMDGYVHALETATGDRRWRIETGHYTLTPTLVVGGVVYIGTGDGYLFALRGVDEPTGGP